MFDREQARKDGNLCRALIWTGKEDGEDQFRWAVCSIGAGPNEHGQYQLVRIRNNWFSVSDNLKNLEQKHKDAIFTGE